MSEKHTRHCPQCCCPGDPKRDARSRAVNAHEGSVKALELAEQYLRHPDVQAIPFALSASRPLAVVRSALRKARGEE
jgi:hypothetical protein